MDDGSRSPNSNHPSSNHPSPRTRDKLHLQVASAFEASILSGELPVGDRLPSEGDIAARFGVSTRSVREAMQILETKGLIRRRHGGRSIVMRSDVSEFLGTLAATVRQLLAADPDYLMQLMVVRRMMETEVLGLLCAREDPLSSEVEAALEAMRTARDEGNFTGFTEADAEFHFALVRSAGNKILTLFYDNLHGLITDVIRVTSRVPSKSLEDAFAEHASICDAIRTRNAGQAQALMKAHIDNSADYLRLAIEKINDKERRNA